MAFKWKPMLKLVKEKRSVVDVIGVYLWLGKFCGYTIFTVVRPDDDNVQSMDFRFDCDDLILYMAYLATNLLLFYYGFMVLAENASSTHIIRTVGAELVLTMSMITALVSCTVIIVFRRKLKKMLQLIHQFDTQVGRTAKC